MESKGGTRREIRSGLGILGPLAVENPGPREPWNSTEPNLNGGTGRENRSGFGVLGPLGVEHPGPREP